MEQLFDVCGSKAGFEIVRSGDLPRRLQRNMLADAVLSQMIDQFVPCDSVQPGRERQRPVVARALPVNRDQRLLHQILQVRAISARTAREVDPQTLCNGLEQLMVSFRSEEHTSELQ